MRPEESYPNTVIELKFCPAINKYELIIRLEGSTDLFQYPTQRVCSIFLSTEELGELIFNKETWIKTRKNCYLSTTLGSLLPK